MARFERLPHERMEYRVYRGVPLTTPSDAAQSSCSIVTQIYCPPIPNTEYLIYRHFLFIAYPPLLENKLQLE